MFGIVRQRAKAFVQWLAEVPGLLRIRALVNRWTHSVTSAYGAPWLMKLGSTTRKWFQTKTTIQLPLVTLFLTPLKTSGQTLRSSENATRVLQTLPTAVASGKAVVMIMGYV